MKKFLAVFLSALLCVQNVYAMPAKEYIVYEDTEEAAQGENAETAGEEGAPAQNAGPEVSAPSAILMEASTGEVIYEKDADTPRPPASVTKVMTMLLIFDALAEGKIKAEDEVTTSEYAASMGGSQVFLEPGETQSVDTMLKCISVASANDACVAMAEYISGSEEEFVRQMNERAKGLGMENTNFVNCNGLDVDGHVTTARDIALMSRELITKYPQIHDYCMIWMENITHTTKKGTTEFGLTNTNKLVRQYEYATGLKTGSTGLAKFCVSATAKKNDIEMISVIMAAEDSKARFRDATALLNYGFGKCQLYKDENPEALSNIKIKGGVEESVPCEYNKTFSYLNTTGEDLSGITKKLKLKKDMDAPVKKGDIAGSLTYELDGKEIGKIDVVITKDVEKAGFLDYLKKVVGYFRT
ncbi:D-alanyl-D-alanine carboxypeptidase family protein [Luxibacter massiliensis]|uniref:D-alanyl-D-alanine carboxypeptidase family protein n=1 Tax=Luxibacter massiliensis TaxID=2219695 RepID=UPI000F06397B|nr:D-alanyl-D-alanine carboxypeptidase family protein [Luxibacter massiliensis]